VTYITAFAASFVMVAFKAFQQLNVVHYNYRAILPTSLMLAICEVTIVSLIAVKGFGWIILPVALGGGLGCLLTMNLYEKKTLRDAEKG